MNNPKFNDYIDVTYPEELEIKDTTDAPKWVNYLDLHLEFIIWSLMRMVDVTHYSMTNVMTDLPISNFPYLSNYESPA